MKFDNFSANPITVQTLLILICYFIQCYLILICMRKIYFLVEATDCSFF